MNRVSPVVSGRGDAGVNTQWATVRENEVCFLYVQMTELSCTEYATFIRTVFASGFFIRASLVSGPVLCRYQPLSQLPVPLLRWLFRPRGFLLHLPVLCGGRYPGTACGSC